jgi:hypothetical protein
MITRTTPEHRSPDQMEIAELTDALRHAAALLELNPGAQLARALANFLFAARKQLETRGVHECGANHSS